MSVADQDAEINLLVGIGFSKGMAMEALEANNGDVDAALDYLIESALLNRTNQEKESASPHGKKTAARSSKKIGMAKDDGSKGE